MTGLVGLGLGLVAAFGTYLLYTAVVLRWTGVGLGPARERAAPPRRRIREWMVQAGLEHLRPVDLVAGVVVFAAIGAATMFVIFGGVMPPLVAALAAGAAPVAMGRRQRRRRREQAREAWPRMIEEIRLQTTTLGRSIPQALFTVGQRAPHELRPAFGAAHREWLLSTDFERTLDVLRERLADATADAVCETLLVANDIGGSDIDERLHALIDDRVQDLQGRKDAESKQAGARFARRFVLIVPFGMALAGRTIGTGRAAYATAAGQLLILVALGIIVACWLWAGRIMRLPEEQRVFAGHVEATSPVRTRGRRLRLHLPEGAATAGAPTVLPAGVPVQPADENRGEGHP